MQTQTTEQKQPQLINGATTYDEPATGQGTAEPTYTINQICAGILAGTCIGVPLWLLVVWPLVKWLMPWLP